MSLTERFTELRMLHENCTNMVIVNNDLRKEHCDNGEFAEARACVQEIRELREQQTGILKEMRQIVDQEDFSYGLCSAY